MDPTLEKEKIVNGKDEVVGIAKILEKDLNMKINTRYGFKKILRGELLIWRDSGVFIWQKAKGDVYGSIITEQESIPCVYVSISQQINKKIVYAYSSCERIACCVDIYWKKGNECWHTEFRDDILIKSKKIQKIPDLGVGHLSLDYKDGAGFGGLT